MQGRNQELMNKYYAHVIASSEKGEIKLAITDYTKAVEIKPAVVDSRYCWQFNVT